MTSSNDSNRSRLRVSELVVMLLLTIAMACVLAPALAQVQAETKQNACINNAKQIALALLNHHDTRKSFPLASTKFITARPGHAGDADAAGFSWLTMLLPYVEQFQYWELIVRTSDKFKKDPFDPTVTSKEGANGLPFPDQKFDLFLCPSYLAGRQDDAPVLDEGKEQAKRPPGVSNYHAMAGSHFVNGQGIGRFVPKGAEKQADGRIVAKRPYEGNGGIVFPGQIGNRIQKMGLGLQAFTDGTSPTMVFAETIEPEFGGWIDGQLTWLVAAWPGNPDIPGQLPKPGEKLTVLGWTDEQLKKNWLSLGHPSAREEGKTDVVYLPAARWSGGKDRKWGPSSYHGPLVVHAFADAHVKMIREDVDKNVYLHLATRDGREVVPDTF